NGGLVIDTPGMRELQMWVSGEVGQEAFADIEAIALKCHFRNCSHTTEKRCALLDAVAKGELPQERYESYLKLKRELNFLSEAARQRKYTENKRRPNLPRRTSSESNRRSGE